MSSSTHFVGPYVYTVEEVDHLEDEGRCYPDRLLIQIRAGLDSQRREMVLNHELLHAVMDLTGQSQQLGDREEAVVDALAPWITVR